MKEQREAVEKYLRGLPDKELLGAVQKSTEKEAETINSHTCNTEYKAFQRMFANKKNQQANPELLEALGWALHSFDRCPEPEF